jgi:hypothetical protein
MRGKRAKVEAAALTVVKDSNQQDEVFVVNFNDEAYLDLPHGKTFTSDIKEMEEALTRIDSRGGTAMRDAIGVSIDHLSVAESPSFSEINSLRFRVEASEGDCPRGKRVGPCSNQSLPWSPRSESFCAVEAILRSKSWHCDNSSPSSNANVLVRS